MQDDTIACAGARLTGRYLSGRDRGGGLWTVDLGQVTGAVYSEQRGLSRVRLALRLQTPEGWREVAIEAPRQRMSQARDVLEHRALAARVAELLADLSPGFRIAYRVAFVPDRLLRLVGLGGVAAMAILGFALPGAMLPLGGAVVFAAAGLGLLAWYRARRRVSDVSAAALPGILTAMGRRE